MSESYVVRSWGPLHHQWWDTQPKQKYGMIEEIWHLGPFELVRNYVREDPKNGSWSFSASFALRRWLGPWIGFSFGSGAQSWDNDDAWWKEDRTE